MHDELKHKLHPFDKGASTGPKQHGAGPEEKEYGHPVKLALITGLSSIGYRIQIWPAKVLCRLLLYKQRHYKPLWHMAFVGGEQAGHVIGSCLKHEK